MTDVPAPPDPVLTGMRANEVPHIFPENRSRRPDRANYHARYRHEGKMHREPTGARTLVEFATAKANLEDMFRSGTWRPWKQRKGDELGLFAAFAQRVLDKRIAMGVASADKDERGIIKNHLNPEFGNRPLHELTSYATIEAAFARIAAKPSVGGATVHNIYRVFKTIMRRALKESRIAVLPPALTVNDGDLPAKLERRPEGWRDEAIFELEEIAKLLAAESIPAMYRTMYAVYFLTGSRFREVTQLRVRDYLRAKRPLRQLTIRAVKTGRQRDARYRVPPVHPALAVWLDWWLDEGFELTHMRRPQPGDLMFPTISVRRRNAHKEDVSHGELYKQWARHHLPDCGLRHRRLHDARRTLLSAIRSAGADKEVARAITHSVIADKVLDAYTTFEWKALCEAMIAIDWRLPSPPALARTQGATVVDLASRRG